MKHFKDYLHSFSFKFLFLRNLIIDILSLGSIALMIHQGKNYLVNKSNSLMGGRTLEEMQALLLQDPSLATQYQGYVMSFFSTIIVLTVLTFVIFSFSRQYLWDGWNHTKILKWNVLHLALIIPALVYAVVGSLVKLVVAMFFGIFFKASDSFYYNNAAIIDGILLVLNNVVSFLLILLFFAGLFKIYQTFAKTDKIWDSIGAVIQMDKTQWALLWIRLLLATFTAIILTAILIPVRQFVGQSVGLSLINFVIALLFVSWMRLYVIKTHKH